MTNQITIRKAPGKWSVRSGGAILGETNNALELLEGENDPVIYFPRSDIAMAFLDRSDKVIHDPIKGKATHFSIVNRSSVAENAAWSFENPGEAIAQLKDYLAFYPEDSIKVEQL
ncbi:conserved domain protein [Rhodobacteraceae bacterium KLH11]|nr:conserved domain protein [Rhodobacteraceae bacterium KLH11]